MSRTVEQALILVGSLAGITGLSLGTPWAIRVGCSVALVGQWGWVRSSLRHRQWGVLAVSCYFTVAHAFALVRSL